MRELADAPRIRRFMRALGAAAPREGDCYRFPAVDPVDFGRSVEEFLGS